MGRQLVDGEEGVSLTGRLTHEVQGVRAEDSAAAQIRQGEGAHTVAAIGRAQDREQGRVLGDRQDLALSQHPALRYEAAGIADDLADEGVSIGRQAAVAVEEREDALDIDQIVDRQ